MITNLDNDFIVLKTNHDGDFKVTITSKKSEILYSEVMTSCNQQIRLEGFSLKKHTVTISPTNQAL